MVKFSICGLLIGAVTVAAQVAPLRQLQASVAVEAVTETSPQKLAGEYSSPPKEIGVSLTGDNLYLFPDGTYIFDEWGDVEPQPFAIRAPGR